MPKRILSEGVLDKFFSLFVRAKAQNKQTNWLSRLRKEDPELADIWSKWDTDVDDMLSLTKKLAKEKGIDSTDIDSVIKKYS